MIALNSANATDAEFWRHLVSNVAWVRPDQWGSGDVSLGLSRKVSRTTVLQAAGASFELCVYSWAPFLTGLLALGLFTVSFVTYAARTPLLRDGLGFQHSRLRRSSLDRLDRVWSLPEGKVGGEVQ